MAGCKNIEEVVVTAATEVTAAEMSEFQKMVVAPAAVMAVARDPLETTVVVATAVVTADEVDEQTSLRRPVSIGCS